jgi:hypothetical protein
MKVGNVVWYKRNPEDEDSHLGIIIEKDDEFFRVFDKATKKVYDVFKVGLNNSDSVIKFQN